MLPAGQVRIYLACGFTDIRKGFHSLAAQVQTSLQQDPYSGALYIFRGRRGEHTTFYIQFAHSTIAYRWHPLFGRTLAGLATSARQGSDVHLYGRAAWPQPGVAELDVRRDLLRRHGARGTAGQCRGAGRTRRGPGCRSARISAGPHDPPPCEAKENEACGEADITIERSSCSNWGARSARRRVTPEPERTGRGPSRPAAGSPRRRRRRRRREASDERARSRLTILAALRWSTSGSRPWRRSWAIWKASAVNMIWRERRRAPASVGDGDRRRSWAVRIGSAASAWVRAAGGDGLLGQCRRGLLHRGLSSGAERARLASPDRPVRAGRRVGDRSRRRL